LGKRWGLTHVKSKNLVEKGFKKDAEVARSRSSNPIRSRIKKKKKGGATG